MKLQFNTLISRLVVAYKAYVEDRDYLRTTVTNIEEKLRQGGLDGISFMYTDSIVHNLTFIKPKFYQIAWLEEGGVYSRNHIFIRPLSGDGKWTRIADIKDMDQEEIEAALQKFLVKFTEYIQDIKNKLK